MTVIPQFLLKKVYVSGSLKYTDDGISFDIQNAIAPGIITKVSEIDINDQVFMSDEVYLYTNGTHIHASGITKESPIFFPLHQKVSFFVKTDDKVLREGENKIKLKGVSREAGLLKVIFTDTITL